MFLLSLAGAVQQIIHTTLLSDRAVDHLIDYGGFGMMGTILHTLNRKTGRRADRERREQLNTLEKKFTDHAAQDEKIRNHILQEFEARDADGRALLLKTQDRIAALATEVRELAVLVKNGLHEDVRDIKARLAKSEEREIERADKRRRA